MHELGLVNYVVKEVGKIAEENKVSRIRSVTLEFGEVSGIVTSYLYDYWLWYTKKFPMFEGAELNAKRYLQSHGVMTAGSPTAPSPTERHARTAEAAEPGCFAATRCG